MIIFPILNYLCTFVILSPQHLGNRSFDFLLESYPIPGLCFYPKLSDGHMAQIVLLGVWFSLASRIGSAMIM